MSELSIYEIFNRSNYLNNNLINESIRNDCLKLNLNNKDNIHVILNKCFKIIRNNTLNYIKEELIKKGFENTKIIHNGEASKSITGNLKDIKVNIDYRILANNLISINYTLKKNKKKKSKQLNSLDVFFEELNKFKNEY